MPVSPAVRKELLERLNAVAPVSDRSMFGAVGLYCEERFFGIIDDDGLFFRVDDATRPVFLKAGMGPFAPFGLEKSSKSYYRVPDGVIADKRKLKAWLIKAVAAAEKAKAKSKEKRGGKGAKKNPMNAKAARGLGTPRTGRR